MISIKQEIKFIFSKDASIQKKSNFLAICITFIFWILFFLLIAFLPSSFSKKQKYETVKIVLSESQKKIIEPVEKKTQPKIEEKIEKNQEKIQSVVKKEIKQESQPIVEKKQNLKQEEKSNQNIKKEESEKKVQEQKSEQIEYALDPMEAFALQTSKQSEQEFDWSKFDENSTITNSFSNENYVLSENKFEGFAGEISSSSSNKTSLQTEKKDFINTESSSITNSTLKKIANTSFVENSSSKVTTKSNVNSAISDDGKIKIKTNDGRFRALIEPEKPILNVSDKNAPDGSRTVTIIFKIQPNGYILKSDVSITPAAVLSDSLREELISQIATWRFESTDFSSIASFEFNIVRI